MLLVAALRGGERAPGGEAEAAVGLALQRREVVEQRRALGALLALELRDDAGLAAHGGDDRVGLRGALQARLRAVVVAALVHALTRRGEERVDEPVRLGHERADLLLAARDDRQRRRLHAAQRDGAVEGGAQADRRRAGGVHADDPVGLRARPGGRLELGELRGGAQLGEGALHRGLRHRRQPQPLRRASWSPPSRTGRRRSARPRGRRRRR